MVALCIQRHGDPFDMVRTNTSGIPAKMISDERLRRRAFKKVVSPHLLVVNGESAIAFPVETSDPYPARAEIGAVRGHRAILVDLLPEADFISPPYHATVMSPARMMHRAPTATIDLFGTAFNAACRLWANARQESSSDRIMGHSEPPIPGVWQPDVTASRLPLFYFGAV